MKLYLAAPLFSTPEQEWNTALTARLEAAGHEVFLPQAQKHEPNPTGAQIFAKDLEGLDWCDGVVAVMDGPDPDSGTCWEVGYAYGVGKPIVLLRTDFRRPGDVRETPYNPMLVFSADVHLELPLASLDAAAAAILEALQSLPAR